MTHAPFAESRPCNADQFTCAEPGILSGGVRLDTNRRNPRCIASTWKCDGTSHQCFLINALSVDQSILPISPFPIGYPQSTPFEGEPDCADHSDEKDCPKKGEGTYRVSRRAVGMGRLAECNPKTQFTCNLEGEGGAQPYCIPLAWQCDNQVHHHLLWPLRLYLGLYFIFSSEYLRSPLTPSGHESIKLSRHLGCLLWPSILV